MERAERGPGSSQTKLRAPLGEQFDDDLASGRVRPLCCLVTLANLLPGQIRIHARHIDDYVPLQLVAQERSVLHPVPHPSGWHVDGCCYYMGFAVSFQLDRLRAFRRGQSVVAEVRG